MLNNIHSNLETKHSELPEQVSINAVLSSSSIFLRVRPVELKEANKFIVALHRHHKEVQGHKFSIGCYSGEELLGVAVCGRPVSRHLDNGLNLEVTRLCTSGGKNICSKLYSACARIAKELGYDSIITYILASETGVSLRASGWMNEGEAGDTSWDRPKRRRDVATINLFGEQRKYPNEKKQRWRKKLN